MISSILLGMAISKILMIIAAVIAAICVLLLVATPRHVHVERSISIQAPIELIYDQIATTQHWVVWSPWFKRDPNIEIKFNDIPRGKGAHYQWKGNKKVGQGEMEIVDTNEPHRVDLALAFVGQGEAKAYFTLAPQGDAVDVTWGFDTDMGMNPIGRVFGLFMDKMLGPDYEEGLANLKEVCESK